MDMDYKEQYKKYKNKYRQLKREILSADNYPYYKNNYELTKNKFSELVRSFKPEILNYVPNNMRNKDKIEKYDGRYFIIKENWDKNQELNNLTDWFTEECRIKCRFGKYIAPFDYWEMNKINLLKTSQDTNKLRDMLYYKTKLCNNFRISLVLTILKLFNCKKYLDISAGWGDRLIGAIASDVDLYVSADPNKCLYDGYDKIISTLADKNKQDRFIIHRSGFENANITDQFDLVFSSPPFFDLEIYSDSVEDSYKKYNQESSWYDGFLIPSLRKAASLLIKGGHMVLYIDESINTNYIDKLVRDVNSFMTNKGSIYYFYPNKMVPRRFFVWKK